MVVTNAGTGIVSRTLTNNAGEYQLLNLPIGNYSATVEAPGFARSVTRPQELSINQSLRIDVRLQIGQVSQTVEVESIAPQVETVNPTLGGTVTGAPIQNLPLNGRNVLDLALTQPGVTPAAGSPMAGSGVPTGEFTIAGARDNAITYLLDGGDNTSVVYGVPVLNPNPDTIAEFRILENNYTAEYGRSAGGVVSVVTKSGTNQLHGTAFDYLRNDALNSNTFFNNESGQPRPILKRNQFGGTFGGPIVIPKIVNGKDRLFFFFGYQGQRQSSVLVGPEITTFTPAELRGDFSHSQNGGPDAGVAAFLQNNSYFQPNPAFAANAVIDPSKIDPVAQKYISSNLVPVSANGLLVPNGSASDDRDEYTGKVDFNITDRDKLTVTLGANRNPVTYPFLLSGAPDVPGFPGLNQLHAYFGNITYVKTFSPTLLNELRFTAQRANNELNVPARQLPTPAALGVNITPDESTGPPQIILAASNLQLGFNINGPAHYADTTYLYGDTLTWVRGAHTWKAGGSVAIVQNNAYFAYAVNGQYTFSGPSGIGSGNDRADFLLGAPNTFEQYPLGVSAVRSHQNAAFVQDEWKVNPRLVLTLGVRYEYDTPKTDPQKRRYSLIPGLQSQRFPLAPLGLVFPGDPGSPHGSTFPDRNNWAPRFGFALDPFGNGRTSIRGGFGVFYDVLLGQNNQYQNGTPPFFSAAYIACLNVTCAPITGATGALSYLANPYAASGTTNPFPSAALPPSKQLNFATQGFLPFGPSSVFLDPHMVTPYVYQYNFSVQQQIGSTLAAQAGYVGSSSHKLTAQVDEDPIILGTATRLLNTQPGLQIPNAFAQAIGNANAVTASYNSLVASLTKRMSDLHFFGNTFFTLSYTYAHNINDANGMFRNSSQVPYYNHHQFRASSDDDIRQRLVLSGGWELPFAHLWPGLSKRLTSGWSLFPIAYLQTGLPMDVNAGLYVDGTPGPSGAGDQNLIRPDWNGASAQTFDPHRVQTFLVDGAPLTGHFAFDPSGINVPSCYTSGASCGSYTYGTPPRNAFRGPGRVNFDLSLEKKTALTERLQLIFRAEFFNILNHTQWQNPVTGAVSVYSPQLGQITSTYDPRIGQLALKLLF